MALSGPHQIFAEGIAAGLKATEAYAKAYPSASKESARKNAARLKANEGVTAEIARIRNEAEKLPGSAILTVAEKRNFLARLVRASIDTTEPGSDLWQEFQKKGRTTKRKLGDKLRAIALDNDLAGEGSEAEGNLALAASMTEVMDRIRSKRWRK